MPTLQWIGKEKVINHHREVPFRMLDKKYSFGEENSGNKIIHGDNLEALKALLPEYEGKIKCIYIDPPYNTGNEGWVYNDNVNDPRIRKWLGQVVGSEADDLTRHDKWLCMMYPRLRLLQKLLSEDGVIFISIDDNEIANLRLICDEIFGARNFVSTCIRRKNKLVMKGDKTFKCVIEPLIVYAKNKSLLDFSYTSTEVIKSDFSVISAGYGIKQVTFQPNELRFRTANGYIPKGQYKTLLLENNIEIDNYTNQNEVVISAEFKWSEAKIKEKIHNNAYILVKDNDTMSMRIYFESTGAKPLDYIDEKYGIMTNEAGIRELDILGFKGKFDYPKPLDYISFLLNIINSKDAIILDSFAGSGTTAHAVLNLNKQDGGNRKFILVELGDYADTITAERVRRAIVGYGEGKNAVEGTGGGFDFYELGTPVFDELTGEINKDLDIEQLKQYVWYVETASKYSPQQEKYYLGEKDKVGYYFINDKVLDKEALIDVVKTKAEQYIIYADACLLSEEFRNKNNIVFKQIPQDIKRV
jgi:adenine-specific DNA-methyltransferase